MNALVLKPLATLITQDLTRPCAIMKSVYSRSTKLTISLHYNRKKGLQLRIQSA